MKHIGFLLIDGYAMMPTAAALEPLRAANLFASEPLYDFSILAPRERCARSSVGGYFEATPIRDIGPELDLIFVVAGGDMISFADATTLAWLRRMDDAGIALGGISGGAAILARAGLLQNRRFTIHWHHYDEMRRAGPDMLLERRIYVIDRDRYTCAGGTAPLDMMHQIIAREHGTKFAQRISDWFIQAEIRVADAPQKSSIAARYGPVSRSVQAALELMETHVADPLDLSQIASLSGLSARQLQRRFREDLGVSVMAMYRTVRLETAQSLLRDTKLSIGEIALLSGFQNQAHFSECHREHFGRPPSALRK